MQNSLQNVLLSIPLTQCSFLTTLPKDLLHYDDVIQFIPKHRLERPTLIILESESELEKLNESNIIFPLIQDSNLKGIVICLPNDIAIEKNISNIFQETGLCILQIYDSSYTYAFKKRDFLMNSYTQASIELQEFKEFGFTKIAERLSFALEDSFQYFDENGQLLWQIGEKEELIEGMRSFNASRRRIKRQMGLKPTMEIGDSFEIYKIQIANSVSHYLLTSSQLMEWQKRMIDKFVGLTSIILQTKEIVDEHEKGLKEHFIYDLLYHKFESKRVLVKQGMAWGWNLARPHHLILINLELNNELTTDVHWLERFIFIIEEELTEKVIVFPFHDQVVILLEDGEERSNIRRKDYVSQVAHNIKEVLAKQLSDIQFTMGIGKWYRDTIYLNKSYQEAKLALKFGKDWFGIDRIIFHIDNLGVLRLLIHIHQELLFDFSEEYLSELVESDKEQGTEHMKTLQTYIQHNENVQEVSDLLYIHPNTLRKRIRQIEEITGLQTQESDDLMTLKIAVKIYYSLNK